MLSISHKVTPPELGGGAETIVVAAIVALDRLQLARFDAVEILLR